MKYTSVILTFLALGLLVAVQAHEEYPYDSSVEMEEDDVFSPSDEELENLDEIITKEKTEERKKILGETTRILEENLDQNELNVLEDIADFGESQSPEALKQAINDFDKNLSNSEKKEMIELIQMEDNRRVAKRNDNHHDEEDEFFVDEEEDSEVEKRVSDKQVDRYLHEYSNSQLEKVSDEIKDDVADDEEEEEEEKEEEEQQDEEDQEVEMKKRSDDKIERKLETLSEDELQSYMDSLSEEELDKIMKSLGVEEDEDVVEKRAHLPHHKEEVNSDGETEAEETEEFLNALPEEDLDDLNTLTSMDYKPDLFEEEVEMKKRNLGMDAGSYFIIQPPMKRDKEYDSLNEKIDNMRDHVKSRYHNRRFRDFDEDA